MSIQKVLKLVRVDVGLTSPPDSGIILSQGLHPFGRGVFLDCTDKRVSRQHGKLAVSDEGVTLTALHTNPCFVIKRSDSATQVLKSGSSLPLARGDKFGLLPSSHWYELVEADLPGEVAPRCDPGHRVDGAEEWDEEINFPFEEDMQDTERCASPSLLDRQNAEKNNTETPTEVTHTNGHTSPLHDDNTTLSPGLGKRTHSDDNQKTNEHTNKQAKRSEAAADDADVKPDVNMLNAAMAGASSSTSIGVNGDDVVEVKKEVKTEPGTSALHTAPVTPAPPGRERCMYGAKCYRRNPQHKSAYSHPDDADWGRGERGVCPWGAGCTRRDPRHWRDHTHPPGVLPPPPGAHARGPPTVVVRHGNTFYINAHSVHFHDQHFSVEDSDGESVDYDYEF